MKLEFLNRNVQNRDNFVRNWSESIKPNAKVLDVGAGTGPYRFLFRHTEYFTHDSTPLSNNQLRGNKGYTKIDFVSDILNIPLENDSIDAIICTEVLEHVINPIGAINEMKRILKPGGKLLITAPLGSGIHQAPYHFYGGFTPYFYENVLGDYFDNIQIAANGTSYLFFYQEGLRFAKMNLKTYLLPITFPISCMQILLCMFIGLFDRLKIYRPNRDFVVGYHVTAEKKNSK